MNRAIPLILAAFLVALLGGDTSAFASTSTRTVDQVASVPEGQRERLRQRLDAFVASQARGDFRTAYSFLSSIYRGSFASNLRPDDFAGDKSRRRLRSFAIRSCLALADGTYLVSACGEYDRRGPNLRAESVVVAVFETDDWYFSDVTTHIECLHCGLQPCRRPQT